MYLSLGPEGVDNFQIDSDNNLQFLQNLDKSIFSVEKMNITSCEYHVLSDSLLVQDMESGII